MAMVNVLVKGVPGQMDESELEKREGFIDNEDEYTTWVEYWKDGELVHRSAHVTLKKWPEGLGAVAAQFGE
jgi:hypothetical protein